MNAELAKPSFEWLVGKGSEWRVKVKGWNNGTSWCWNIYLLITPGHDLFTKPENFFHDLPFHGGATYDRVNTVDWPEYKYDFQKPISFREIGSDYSHLHDDFTECSPYDGIPNAVLSDANALISYLQSL
ncbi:hypothetical protein ACREYP_08905 [Enterobacter sp. TMH.L2]